MNLPSEEQIQNALLDLLKLKGFDLAYHTWNAQHSAPGFPDIVAARRGQLVAIECKSATGKVSLPQMAWIAILRTVPGVVFSEVVGPTATPHWISYDAALERIGAL